MSGRRRPARMRCSSQGRGVPGLAPAAGLARVFLRAEKTEDRKMGAGEFTPAVACSQAFPYPLNPAMKASFLRVPLPATVWILGAISFLNDAACDLVCPLLPNFLATISAVALLVSVRASPR